MNPIIAANIAAKIPTGFMLDSTANVSNEKDSVTVRMIATTIMAELITKVLFCISLSLHSFTNLIYRMYNC